MATATERKFTSLRKRLDQLGYRQPLGIESLPLVDKLFGDLLHTTESLKTAKQQLGKHKEEKGVWEQHVEPYQTDNARVIKENNDLHQQLMKSKENSEQRIREVKAVLRRFEHENADLKFLNTQYLQRLRTQEKESERKTEKILELQEKNFQAVIQTPGGKKRNIPFRRQRMEIDCALQENDKRDRQTANSIKLPAPDPYVADLLQVADQRMSQLQSLVEQESKEKEKLQDSVQAMRKLIENREVEIERLTQMLKGGRPAEALAAEGIRQSRERMVAHLNIQVDFLQKASHELEKKLAESEEIRAQQEERVKELTTKNARICSELQEIGDLVKQTEQDRVQSEEQLQARISQLETEKSQLLSSQEEVEKDLQRIVSEKAELLEDNQRMAKLLANSEGDRKEVADLLERLSEERKKFQRQCELFKDQEKTLQQKICELECPSHSRPGIEVRKLRKERDELKNAVSSFEKELLEIQMDTRILAEDRDNFKLLYEQVSEELMRTKQQAYAPSASGAAVLRRMEGERDHALMELQQKKIECHSLQDRLKTLQDTQEHDLNTLEDKLAELRVQMGETSRERDELLERLSSTKKLLTSLEVELENSTSALSTANGEVVRYRSKVSQLQALVEASERTRQDQQKGIRTHEADVQAAQSTVASLNSKIAQLSHEVNAKEEKMLELRHALTMLDQDHDQLVSETDRKDETIASLTLQLEQKEASLAGVEGRVVQLQTDLGRAEGCHRDKEMQASAVQGELNTTNRELRATREQIDALTQQVNELKDDLSTMTQENQAIHGELQRTVNEKDSLGLKMEDYAQTLMRYEEAVSLKEREKSELVHSYNTLNTQTGKLNSTLEKMQGSLSSTKMELFALAKEKKEVEDVLEQQASEIQILRAYEQQLSNMSIALSKMENALRQEQEEKKALMIDLEATRELCVQLDKSKESLGLQLSTASLHYDQVQSQIGDAKAERDLLKAQLQSERSTTEQLQGLISTERQKEFQAHMVGKEKEEELQHLRQLLAKLEADRLSLAEQTRKLRADTAVQSESLHRLKSELASEKFQKEHMKQQLSAQQSTLALLTSSSLHANPRTPSPQKGTTPPRIELPEEPVLSSPQSTPSLHHDSRREDELFTTEKQNLAYRSAKLVDKLLHTSSSSDATPPSTAHPSPAKTPQITDSSLSN